MGRGSFALWIAAATFLAGCKGNDQAPIPATRTEFITAIPLRELSVEPGEVFPKQLSEIESGCSYPAIKNPPLLDELSRKGYAESLLAAGEPSLISVAQGAPSEAKHLRFIWLRSFDPPAVVRVSIMPDGEAKVTAKLLNSMGGYEPEVANLVERPLELAEASAINDFIENSNLLNEPATTCEITIDGASWTVEFIENGSYHFIERWSPEDGPVRGFGLMMLRLAGWRIEPDDIY